MFNPLNFAAMQFTVAAIVEATDNFSERLGLGGFGVVYRGLLNGCGVAVKKLTEVHIMSGVHY